MGGSRGAARAHDAIERGWLENQHITPPEAEKLPAAEHRRAIINYSHRVSVWLHKMQDRGEVIRDRIKAEALGHAVRIAEASPFLRPTEVYQCLTDIERKHVDLHNVRQLLRDT